ncbi:MAG: radical SAM protein, partial [Oscillospiraceae bacterium]|nr:radical SAM protein [Oscillospiraceae bacterium]
MAVCTLCPRRCGADRAVRAGVCGADDTLRVARASLHLWEEPCLAGTRGSGTVFFAGCPLRCVFCQNYEISRGVAGQEITTGRLAAIFLDLQAKGAHNINLVTPTHYVPHIVEALLDARSRGLALPIVYNCGGYELPETLRRLDRLVDIYMPDFKYFSPALAQRYSSAADY